MKKRWELTHEYHIHPYHKESMNVANSGTSSPLALKIK